MIDLHSHTTESDGTFSPFELVAEAKAIGLEALAVTDHDTFAGYDQAVAPAQEAGLDIVCGIELSTRFQGRSVHLLGYFPVVPPAPEFRAWLSELQQSRRDRNARMVDRLQSLGVNLTLAEVEAKGRSLAGRPHFARVMVEKGYVENMQQAFAEYLDESAQGYVERQEAEFGDAVLRIRKAGGVSSVAHPIRLMRNSQTNLSNVIGDMRDCGLAAMEVYHSDHKPSDVALYKTLAEQYGLAATGGSDFHGGNKPSIRLGSGANNNLNVPLGLLTHLRTLVS